MPFDPDAYLNKKKKSGGFDPDAYLSKKQEPNDNQDTEPVKEQPFKDSGPAAQGFLAGTKAEDIAEERDPEADEALVRGLGQMGSINTADEITAGTGALYDYLMGKAGQRGDISYGDAFLTRLDAVQEADKEAKQEYPGAYQSGQVAGGILSMFAPGVRMSKGVGAATAAKNIGKGTGAAFGAGAAGEDSEDLGDRFGAGVDAAKIGGPLSVFGQLAPKAAGKVRSYANQKAVKSLNPILSQQEKLARTGMDEKLGQELLDQGVVTGGRSVKAMLPRVSKLLEGKGRRIGEIRDEVDDAIKTAGVADEGVDLAQLAQKADDKKALSQASNEYIQKAAKSYGKSARSLAKKPRRTIQETQDEVESLSKQVPWNKPPDEWSPRQHAAHELRKDLVGSVDDKIRHASPDKFSEYQELKDKFGAFKGAEEILDKSVARADRNQVFGLNDRLTGILAARSGGASLGEAGVIGAGAALANKLAREHGTSALAASAKNLSKLMASPQALGKYAGPLGKAAERGNKSLMATHLMLMQQDPEYRKLVMPENDEEG